MNKLLKINELKPNNTQILIRTDITTNNWFVNFYYKTFDDITDNWVYTDSIFQGFHKTEEVESILDEIINWCENNK